MRCTRRMKRMARADKKHQVTGLGLNLIPIMDILTVLVFFLLFHSFNGDMPAAQIRLPYSIVETRPRETVHIVVTPEAVLVQDEAVVSTQALLNGSGDMVPEVAERLRQLEPHLPRMAAEDRELTLLADRSIQFKVLKKILSTCTALGYGKISLAVVQKTAKKS